MDRQEHLYDVFAGGKEIIWLVEQAMSQTSTNQDAQEAIDEKRVKDVLHFLLAILLNGALGNALLIEQMAHDEVSESQSDEPAKGVPA